MADLPAIEGFILNREIYDIDKSEFDSTVNELAELLDVKELLKVPVRKLSLGQRMKCELIAALLHQPKVLFLDEPTIGLDILVQKKIRSFFKEYNSAKKTTVLLTSHYMEDVSELCERIIVINKGEIVYDGYLSNLVAEHAKEKYLKLVFVKSVDQKDLKKYGDLIEYDKKNGLSATLRVKRENHTKIASSMLSTLPVDDLDISEVNLEEIIGNIFSK